MTPGVACLYVPCGISELVRRKHGQSELVLLLVWDGDSNSRDSSADTSGSPSSIPRSWNLGARRRGWSFYAVSRPT